MKLINAIRRDVAEARKAMFTVGAIFISAQQFHELNVEVWDATGDVLEFDNIQRIHRLDGIPIFRAELWEGSPYRLCVWNDEDWKNND